MDTFSFAQSVALLALSLTIYSSEEFNLNLNIIRLARLTVSHPNQEHPLRNQINQTDDTGIDAMQIDTELASDEEKDSILTEEDMLETEDEF